jgi:hypothetical protein
VQGWLDIGGANYLPLGMTSELLMAEVNNMAQDAAENCELLVDWFISEYVSAKST